MELWDRLVAWLGAVRLVAALGALEVAMAAVRLVLRKGANDLSDVVMTDLLIAVPGVALLYGAYRLSEGGLHADARTVVASRCYGGVLAMLGVVALLALTTGLNRPVFTPMAGTSLGSLAGYAIGVNEARALSRAREAEEHLDELQRERDLREKIVQTSPIGIVIIDTDGSIRMANEHAAEIVGLTKAELEAIEQHNDPMFEVTDASGDPVEGGMFREILTTGEPSYGVERQITRADGERIWLTLNGAPLRDADGETEAVVLAFREATERKRLEEDLRETVDSLQESNERLEQFAYAASHDLQEPLRMVSSYLRLIESRYADELDEDGQEYIEFAVDGADRMREMIDGLLQYSRVETRGDAFEPVDLQAVVADARADLQVQIEESGAEIETEPLPEVAGDPDQLRQVFQNLLSNGIKYCGDEPPRIRVSAERDGDEWHVAVSDEGIGIDPDEADQIFQVFERLHDSDSHAGTGIGLALVERIVERHGGEIWVESAPGEGSTFHFTLPDADVAPAPTGAPASSTS